MDWLALFHEILAGGLRIGLLVTAIIVPISLGLSLLKDAHLLDRAAASVGPVLRRFRLPGPAAFPLLAGLFLGIVFGSGVILSFAREGSLKKGDLLILLVFLGVCHSIIEDTLIFVALGANGWVLMGLRFLLAFLAAFIVSHLLRERPKPA